MVLSRREIGNIVSRIRVDCPLQQVAISGGEPFLRRDLSGIVQDIVSVGLGAVVITNGTLVTRRRLASFPRETMFETTLFSTDRRLHDRIAGREGAFDRTIDAIIEMRRRGCSVVVAIVISALNAHDVGRTIELAIALGADGVMLNRTNLGARMFAQQRHIVPTTDHLRTSLGQAQAIASKYRLRLPVSIPIPPCVLDPTPYTRLRFGFCPRGGKDSYYTVAPDGRLRPCNHSSVILGDLKREDFGDIVRSARTREFWKPIPAECRSCQLPLGRKCRGGCPAAADECLGSRELPDPLVQVAAVKAPNESRPTAL